MTSQRTDSLVINYSGYGLMRIPIDPDPTDDPRGVSGFTFAFGDEPDLDRVIRLQPAADLVRSHAPDMGVFVRHAERRPADPAQPATEIPGLVGAAMDWEDGPKLENRNLILTAPGCEPIIPFNMRISNEAIDIYRNVPIDPDDPTLPVWKASADRLAAMAAAGMNREPDTIGRATGMWDPCKRVLERIKLLEADLAGMGDDPQDAGRRAVIEGRLKELYFARKNPTNRRVTHSQMVERFAFPMIGGDCAIKGDQDGILGGKLQDGKDANRVISFWIGAWDPDLLTANFEGSLQIPYC